MAGHFAVFFMERCFVIIRSQDTEFENHLLETIFFSMNLEKVLCFKFNRINFVSEEFYVIIGQ